MKNFLIVSMLCGLGGCASLQQMTDMAPPPPQMPATPVFFQTFSAALDDSALTAIGSAAKMANADPNARVRVIGAADSVGSIKANKYLSETRAQVVADALAADGVSPHRIYPRGDGIAPAPAPPGTPAQSARRVLIEIGG